MWLLGYNFFCTLYLFDDWLQILFEASPFIASNSNLFLNWEFN
jgi:hypothetical protein